MRESPAASGAWTCLSTWASAPSRARRSSASPSGPATSPQYWGDPFGARLGARLSPTPWCVLAPPSQEARPADETGRPHRAKFPPTGRWARLAATSGRRSAAESRFPCSAGRPPRHGDPPNRHRTEPNALGAGIWPEAEASDRPIRVAEPAADGSTGRIARLVGVDRCSPSAVTHCGRGSRSREADSAPTCTPQWCESALLTTVIPSRSASVSALSFGPQFATLTRELTVEHAPGV